MQTAAASSIRAVSGLGANVALDGPVVQAAFSKDDTKVVYLTAGGALKIAASTAPASPAALATGVLSILATSADARFVAFATKGQPSSDDSDLLVVDTTAPGTPRSLATDKAIAYGFSADGTKLVYTAPRGLGLSGPLYVVGLPSGIPQKISDEAERVIGSADVVYFQEFVKATKTNTLKAVKLSDLANVITVDQNLDALTAQAMVVGKKLFVGSKLGLWEYPAQ